MQPAPQRNSELPAAAERDESLVGRRREARGAVLAIVGLARSLAGDGLDGSQRADAAAAVRAHCRRLLRLLDESETVDEPQEFSPGSRARVLVAEDCPDSRRAVCSFLSHAGLDVTPAENGRIAVSLALTRNFDLVLLDMQMPEVDGYEAARQLRQADYRGPVIALTGDVRPGDAEACHDAGCDAYLAKPWEPEALLRVLDEYLATKRPLPEHPSAGVTVPAEPTLQQVASEFARVLPARSAEMAAALASNNRRQTARLAHQLAGAAGLFGFPDVCRMARDLERAAAEDGECDGELAERVQDLIETSQRIARRLSDGA
jgi:CheY-like chemotaxis protein/HPt (histidine-containing phosphotransfer) domain-containing protein